MRTSWKQSPADMPQECTRPRKTVISRIIIQGLRWVVDNHLLLGSDWISKWWQSASFSYSSQFPVPCSGIQNTSQFDSRNLAHLQNKLLLSLAHYHPGRSVQEQNAQSETLHVHRLVSTAWTWMFLFRLLLFVRQSWKLDTPSGGCWSRDWLTELAKIQLGRFRPAER